MDDQANCDCLPDCEILQFSTSKEEKPLDTEEECKPGGSLLEYAADRRNVSFNYQVEAYRYVAKGLKIRENPFDRH